jgi:hypothetical protein
MTYESILPLLFTGLIGVLVGGVIRVVVGRYAAFKEGQSIASAIRAEIETLLRVWEDAKFEETIDVYIKRIERPSSLLELFFRSRPTHNDVFLFRVNPKPFQVFDSVCSKIGELGELSAEIVGFYALGKALLTNLDTLRDIWERLLTRKVTVDREALLSQTRFAAERYRQLREVGPRVASALAAHERRWWVLDRLRHKR